MTQGYDTFAFTSWFTDPFDTWRKDNLEQTMVPDSALIPLFQGLYDTRSTLGAASVRAIAMVSNRRERWPLARTMLSLTDTWAHLGGRRFQKLFQSELERLPLRQVPEREAAHLTSYGTSGLDGMAFRFDETLCDPVYLARESGRQMAYRFDVYSSKNAVELQAYFMQEAAYNTLVQRMNDRGVAVRLHRLNEFLQLQQERDLAFTMLDKQAPSDEEEDLAVYKLHQSLSAMPIAIYMYKVFDGMHPDDRLRALNVLYDGRTANFKNITEAFGLKSEDDFFVAGAYVGNVMRKDAIALGLSSRPRRAPPVQRST